MAQKLRVLFAILENPSQVPSTYLRRLPASCNSSFKGSDALFWSLRATHIRMTSIHTNIHIHINKNTKNKSLKIFIFLELIRILQFKKNYVYLIKVCTWSSTELDEKCQSQECGFIGHTGHRNGEGSFTDLAGFLTVLLSLPFKVTLYGDGETVQTSPELCYHAVQAQPFSDRL